MMRFIGALVLLLAVTLAAQGHFLFILPGEGRTARAVFSDELKPDRAELLKKVAHTKFTARIDGKSVAIAAVAGKDSLEMSLPGTGTAWVVGVCPYGVVTRGKEPFLLTYYSRALIGGAAAKAAAPAPDMKLDIIPVLAGGAPQSARVLWQGKPLSGAEVALYVPGKDESVTTKTQADGTVKLPAPAQPGLYAIRARHVEEKAGEVDGKKYQSARSYATCVFRVAARAAEDREASKLLRDARAARANWDGFPGFTADLVVHVEGRVSKGRVTVSARGKVDLEMQDESRDWARRMLSSIVGHRMDDATTLETPCRFADDVTDHPLGRSIRVLNDEFHSSYRIRDRQVIEVNRQMGTTRFTITVLENRLNEEKKFLPVSYVVNTWDARTGALLSSVAHHNTWQRVGPYDLPATSMAVTASAGKLVTRSIQLSGWRLLEK